MNNVTISTDASFNLKLKKGSYSFWISSSLGSYKRSGNLQNNVETSLIAEIQAILNALFFLKSLDKDWYAIRINTDCLPAKNNLDKPPKKEYLINYFNMFNEIKKQLKFKKFKINHVKAHTDNSNPRSYVNNWCDQEAKKALYGYNF
jgi:ribonuclease HI